MSAIPTMMTTEKRTPTRWWEGPWGGSNQGRCDWAVPQLKSMKVKRRICGQEVVVLASSGATHFMGTTSYGILMGTRLTMKREGMCKSITLTSKPIHHRRLPPTRAQQRRRDFGHEMALSELEGLMMCFKLGGVTRPGVVQVSHVTKDPPPGFPGWRQRISRLV